MRHASVIAIVASLSLMACSPSTSEADAENSPEAASNIEQPTLPSPSPSGEAESGDYDPSSPTVPDAERGETGARNVLLSFARAIELREFDQAWEMLDTADQTKWSKAEWRALFADLGKITVAVPSGTMEGAAGSSYYTSEATITATDKDGRPVRYEGPVVLRRVNDVPGASPEQLRWHIDSVKLDWTH